jgi:hypothetical protein
MHVFDDAAQNEAHIATKHILIVKVDTAVDAATVTSISRNRDKGCSERSYLPGPWLRNKKARSSISLLIHAH